MKNIPDEKQLEHLLECVPPKMDDNHSAKLSSAPWTRRAVSRRRTVWLATSAVAAMALLFSATPPGRAWAQEVLRFFVRTDSDHLPLQSFQLTPQPTPTISTQQLSLEDAKNQIGFEPRVFIKPPAGMSLNGVRTEGRTIFIDYSSLDGSCRLTLAESINGDFPDAEIWRNFASSEIDAVTAGGIVWERVHENGAHPAVVRLRWEQQDDWISSPMTMRFEMIQACDPGSTGYLDDGGLMTLAPQTVHIWRDDLISVEQAEAQVGFPVGPVLSSEDAYTYILAGAEVELNYPRLWLTYYAPDDWRGQHGVTLEKWPASVPIDPSDLSQTIGPSAEVKTVSLRGTTGEYVTGVWSLSNNGPIWQNYPNVTRLRWQEDGYWYELSMFTSTGDQTIEQVVGLAERLK